MKISALLIVISFTLLSCRDEEVTKQDHLKVISDQKLLNDRMSSHQDTIFSTNESSGRSVNHFRLILKSSLLPPIINGENLQATSMVNHWGGYLVSYNFQGETYLGAVDYIDNNLKVQSEIQYEDADIHAVMAHDRYVYVIGAKSGLENPAFVEKILLNGNQFSLEENTFQSLGSYAATSGIYHQGSVFVTTGSDDTKGGGIYKLKSDLTVENYSPLHDARWVAGSGNEVFVAQGTPGTITAFNSNKLTSKLSFEFEGANIPESKTTIDVANNRIFVAAGTEGVKVYDDSDGTFLHQITFEEGTITNAVSAENGLLFIANGDKGIFVADYETNSRREPPVILGQLNVAQNQSINHILFRNYRLWVAAGLGGIHQIDIELW